MVLAIIFSSQSPNTEPVVIIDDFQKINSMAINKSAWKTFSDMDNGGGSAIKFSYQKENKSKQWMYKYYEDDIHNSVPFIAD